MISITSSIIGFAVTSFVTSVLLLLSHIAFNGHLSKMYTTWIFITAIACGLSANFFYRALLK